MIPLCVCVVILTDVVESAVSCWIIIAHCFCTFLLFRASRLNEVCNCFNTVKIYYPQLHQPPPLSWYKFRIFPQMSPNENSEIHIYSVETHSVLPQEGWLISAALRDEMARRAAEIPLIIVQRGSGRQSCVCVCTCLCICMHRGYWYLAAVSQSSKL